MSKVNGSPLFNNGRTNADFHDLGIEPLYRLRLKMEEIGPAIKFAAVLRKYGSIWSGPADFLQSRPNSAFCTSETDIGVKLKLFKFALDKSVMEVTLSVGLAGSVD